MSLTLQMFLAIWPLAMYIAAASFVITSLFIVGTWLGMGTLNGVHKIADKTDRLFYPPQKPVPAPAPVPEPAAVPKQTLKQILLATKNIPKLLVAYTRLRDSIQVTPEEDRILNELLLLSGKIIPHMDRIQKEVNSRGISNMNAALAIVTQVMETESDTAILLKEWHRLAAELHKAVLKESD